MDNKTVLITGFTGFVSTYFLEYLDNKKEQVQIVGITRKELTQLPIYKHLTIHVEGADLNDRLKIQDILAYYRPDYILHLASDSSVAYSWKFPINSFQNNTNVFLNLLEGVRILNLPCRVLSVGSSEQYGIVQPQYLPLTEDAPLNPISPYAAARVSQELLSKVYVQGYGLDIVMTRSFNHIGPRQKEQFVISSFAKQMILLKKGRIEQLKTGDLSIVRDFLDVRDVVNAYYLLLTKGKKGMVYNICRGEGHTLDEILTMMGEILNISSIQKSKIIFSRPNDNPIIIGSNQKIQAEVAWKPQITLKNSLKDILQYWDERV
ncbi:MAG: hypothetical protein RLZZ628_861 [Bacteroidota bacterium]|jgi:GDP-4-dehydro-6-deoxy-D-mannose reductase